jgi:hypothetical protein
MAQNGISEAGQGTVRSVDHRAQGISDLVFRAFSMGAGAVRRRRVASRAVWHFRWLT